MGPGKVGEVVDLSRGGVEGGWRQMPSAQPSVCGGVGEGGKKGGSGVRTVRGV